MKATVNNCHSVEITTNHPASNHGVPVLIDYYGRVYGPADQMNYARPEETPLPFGPRICDSRIECAESVPMPAGWDVMDTATKEGDAVLAANDAASAALKAEFQQLLAAFLRPVNA